MRWIVAALVLAVAFVPAANAQCWDYDCPPEDKTGSGDTGGSGTEFCDLFPENCLDEQAQDSAAGNGFKFSHGWTGLWAGICGALLVAGFVLAPLSKASKTGRKITSIPTFVAVALAAVALVVPTIHADVLFAEGSANYFETKISVLGDSETASWYSDDAKEMWSKDTLALMKFAMPAALLGATLMLVAGLLLLAGKPMAPMVLAGATVLLVAVALFSTAMAKEPDMEGTDWSAGFWLMVAAVVVAALSPAVGFVNRRADALAGVAADPYGAAPAQHPPSYVMPQDPAPMAASTPASSTPVPTYGAAPMTSPTPALMTVACPRCKTRVQGARGSAIRCGNCGASGRLPA